VGFTAAHGLGEVEGTVVSRAGQPVETAPDEPLQAIREMIVPKKVASIDFGGGKILDLSDLLDEAVARDESVRDAELLGQLRSAWIDPLLRPGWEARLLPSPSSRSGASLVPRLPRAIGTKSMA
jgi:hypothetical protein